MNHENQKLLIIMLGVLVVMGIMVWMGRLQLNHQLQVECLKRNTVEQCGRIR